MNKLIIRNFFILAFTLNISFVFSQQNLEIYTMPGCGRCSFAIKYLKEHQISYVEHSTSDNQDRQNMWSLLSNSGKYEGGSVSMPVIIHNGNINFNIDDLEAFLSGMGGNQNNNISATTGCISGNCNNGFGTYIWENKDTYTGQFSANNLTGKGKYIWNGGAYYDGEWSNSVQNGYGIYVDENGNQKAGNWVNGAFTGAGNSENNNQVINNNQNQNLSSQQINEFVSRHNFYRAEVNSPKVSWSAELANYAQAWADNLAQNGCDMQHRPESGQWTQIHGENIFWCMGYSPTPASAVDSWASEKPLYDGGVINDKNFEAGHYTQMIWAKTTQIGCAISQCSDGAYIIVCNYSPAGNYWGESPLGN